MRILTIERKKSVVGCLAAMKVYVESATGDTHIDGVPCAKLGTLKNGKTETFYVPEEACRIFIIADRLTKNCCSEVYRLPAGTDPVALTGKICYRPFSGNPFRIDGNDSPEARSHRKKNSRKFWVVMLVACLLGFAVGFFAASGILSGIPSDNPSDIPSDDPKEFTYDNMHITLTEAFEKETVDGYTVSYTSREVAVFCLEERFALMEGFEDLTLQEYADLVIEGNNLSDVKAQTSDGLTWFHRQWTNPEDGEEYYYYAAVYKKKDAFWLIQFAVPLEDREAYADQMVQWASSVRFD